MREVRLEYQVYAYWIGCRDLRLAREAHVDDSDALDDIAHLARFSNHPRLRAACLSRLKCSVVETGNHEEGA